jgi:hypothetical protein
VQVSKAKFDASLIGRRAEEGVSAASSLPRVVEATACSGRVNNREKTRQGQDNHPFPTKRKQTPPPKPTKPTKPDLPFLAFALSNSRTFDHGIHSTIAFKYCHSPFPQSISQHSGLCSLASF